MDPEDDSVDMWMTKQMNQEEWAISDGEEAKPIKYENVQGQI